MEVFRTRIGEIRFKNGATMRLLPSARERDTQAAWEQLGLAIEQAEGLFGEQLAGFALQTWTWDGEFEVSWFAPLYGPVHARMLPDYCAAVIKDRMGDMNAIRQIKGILGERDED